MVESWLPGGKREGEEYSVRNPTRSDAREGSFKVNLRKGFWSDFATGDKGGDFISLYAYLHNSKNQGAAAREIMLSLGLSADAYSAGTLRADDDRVIRYEIKNIDGKLIAVHCRLDKPGGDKVMWWETPDGTAKLKGLKAENLPLCASHRLPKLEDGATVIVVEGEKTCQHLIQAGLAAVGTVSGASKVPGDDALRPLLRFAEIILWPDNDWIGRDHMQRIGNTLIELGYPLSQIKVVDVSRVPGLVTAGADAADLSDDQLLEVLE